MSADLYYQHLIKHLPNLITRQGKSSVLGTLLDLMAEQLHDLDQSMRRVLYDRWAALATGASDENELGIVSASPLDRLGALLEVYRLPPRLNYLNVSKETEPLTIYFRSLAERKESLSLLIGHWTNAEKDVEKDVEKTKQLLENLFKGLKFEVFKDQPILQVAYAPNYDYETKVLEDFRALLKPEPTELFRERLQITANLLHQGIVSPQAILSRTLTNLGVWPCPKVKYPNAKDNLDTTIAWGMPLNYRTGCKACYPSQAITTDPPCRSKAVIEARLTDNPVHQVTEHKTHLQLSEEFVLKHDSLWEDRPSIRIKVSSNIPKLTIENLTIQSRRSAEQLTIKRSLIAGGELIIYPFITREECRYFESYEQSQPHHWLVDNPSGKTDYKSGKTDYKSGVSKESQSLAEAKHHYTTGSIFYGPNANIDAEQCRFGEAGSEQGLRFGLIENRIKTPKLLPGNNSWLISAETAESKKVFIDIELNWFTRPPFNFRVTIPKNNVTTNTYLHDARTRGAIRLVHDDLKRCRAVGIRAELVFPEMLPEFEHHFDDPSLYFKVTLNLGIELIEVVDDHSDPIFVTKLLLEDRYQLDEKHITVAGIFDFTYIDYMLMC